MTKDAHRPHWHRCSSRLASCCMWVGGRQKKPAPTYRGVVCAAGCASSSPPVVLVGSMPSRDETTLKQLAKKKGAQPDGVRLLGQVTDEQLAHLYKGCSAFVFPSWHEGFGLPALEAMAAGAAVLAANTSSLPEVVGQEEALFDPFDVDEIKAKLEQVLTDQAFAQKLRDHAPVQAAKFSWQHTAEQALAFSAETAEAYSAGSVQHMRRRLGSVGRAPPSG